MLASPSSPFICLGVLLRHIALVKSNIRVLFIIYFFLVRNL